MSNSDLQTHRLPHSAAGKQLDEADNIQREWSAARPDLPVRSIGVITRIWQIAKLLSDDRRRTMNALGMDPAIRDLLANLRRSGPPYRLRVSELAVRCHVSKGAITQRVERAQAFGLVTTLSGRGADNKGEAVEGSAQKEDLRAVWIALTDEGLHLVDDTVEALLLHEDKLVACLNGEEIAQFSNLLRKFLMSLEERETGGF